MVKTNGRVLAVSLLGVMILSGCGGAPTVQTVSNDTGSPSAANPDGLDWSKTNDASLKGQTITVLWSETSAASQKFAASIEKEFTAETGIKVKDIGVDYNSVYNKVMTAQMSGSSDIDVVEMDTIWAGQYQMGKVAEDLTNVIPKDVQIQYTSSALSSVEYQGHIMAVPWYSSTKHFYWNNSLLHAAGVKTPPKTWDEFMTDSKMIQQKLGSKGIYASGWSWKQAESLTCDYVGFLAAFGGHFFDKSGNPDFNTGGGVKALQYMTNLMKSGTVDPASMQWTENDVKNAFEAGKIAMMSNWESMYPELNDPASSKVVNQTDVGLLPGEGSVTSAAVTGSEGVALLKSSKHKQAALSFLKFVGSKQYQLAAYKQLGQYPTLQSLYTDPEVIADDTTHTINKISEEFKYGFNRPNAPGYVSWADQLDADLHSAIMGGETPKSALDSAVAKIKSAIANAQS